MKERLVDDQRSNVFSRVPISSEISSQLCSGAAGKMSLPQDFALITIKATLLPTADSSTLIFHMIKSTLLETVCVAAP